MNVGTVPPSIIYENPKTEYSIIAEAITGNTYACLVILENSTPMYYVGVSAQVRSTDKQNVHVINDRSLSNEVTTVGPQRQYRNGAVMIAEIQMLESNQTIYDEECIKPGTYAFSHMRELIAGASEYMRSLFPLGTVYADGSGALRAEWYNKNREISLVIYSGAEDRHYIFRRDGATPSGDYNVTPENLGFYLEWLNNNERTAK